MGVINAHVPFTRLGLFLYFTRVIYVMGVVSAQPEGSATLCTQKIQGDSTVTSLKYARVLVT